MSIDFDQTRWDHIKENNRAWWAGELKRPLISIVMGGHDPGRPEPKLPSCHYTAFYDLSVPAEDIVDRWDYNLSKQRYFGDAFPNIWLNFGPGVVAAFLGAELHTAPEANTIWFHAREDKEIRDIHFNCNPGNIWLNRIKDIMRAALQRWQGLVQVGMTDLGGSLDVLSSFRPGEKLLYDLYDYPEEVKRLNWEQHELWWRYFDELNSVLQPQNPGYSTWAGIFSEDPTYMFQCDFCYMIGPDMFDEFVKPELTASCRRIKNAFYHMDGPGQIPHLDSLLSIEELKGVQWIPGNGNPDACHWPEIYKKIRSAGKLIQVFGDMNILDILTEQLGSAEGIVFHTWSRNESEANEFLSRYGVKTDFA